MEVCESEYVCVSGYMNAHAHHVPLSSVLRS